MTGAAVTITKHTTALKPNPHVLYVVEVLLNRFSITIERRFSEVHFLGDEFALSPKRLLVTSLFPSAWIDDMLLAERKEGLAKYLSAILWSPNYQNAPAVLDFLKRDAMNPKLVVDLEDYLPSTLSRKRLLSIARDVSARRDLDGNFTAAAYYPSWSADSIPPESLDYSRYDVLFFAFARPNSTATLDWGTDTRSVLKRMVKSAADSGTSTKIVLAIGGSEGSKWFNHEFGLNGVAVDWESPNSKGFGNPYSSGDGVNLLNLLKALRSALGTASIIFAAVGRAPWIGENDFSLDDVSQYSEQLTFINIMNYGTSDMTNPMAHSSLSDAEEGAPSTAMGAVSAWNIAGFPTSKILLGIPLFAYVFKSKKTGLAKIDSLDSFAKSTFTGAVPRAVADGFTSGKLLAAWRGMQTPFKYVVKSGALVKRFDGNYGQGDGYTLAWDDASSTPYLFNTEQGIVVTFDNTRSIAAKVHFAKATGLAGCCTWSLDQDDGTTLQDVICNAIGK